MLWLDILEGKSNGSSSFCRTDSKSFVQRGRGLNRRSRRKTGNPKLAGGVFPLSRSKKAREEFLRRLGLKGAHSKLSPACSLSFSCDGCAQGLRDDSRNCVECVEDAALCAQIRAENGYFTEGWHTPQIYSYSDFFIRMSYLSEEYEAMNGTQRVLLVHNPDTSIDHVMKVLGNALPSLTHDDKEAIFAEAKKSGFTPVVVTNRKEALECYKLLISGGLLATVEDLDP